MLEFLTPQIIASIITAALAVIALSLLWYKGKKKEVLMTIDYLVGVAENKFGAGTGEIKYSFVTSSIYPNLPLIVKLFVSAETLDNWIEEGVDKLQVKLKEAIEKN